MAQLAALILAVFGVLPIANWIVGGHAAPWYHERLALWAVGGAAVGTVALVVGLGVRKWPALWSAGRWALLAERWRHANHRADAAVAALAALLYAGISHFIFSAKPLLTDEIVQLFQGRIFASGRLWAPAAPYPEFTSAINVIDWGGKVYGQFPAGGPAMLAVGTLLHAEWLVGPIVGALGVYAFARLLRIIEVRDGVSLAALLLFAFAPFCAFLNGSMMNHVTTTTWLVVAALALAHATRTADVIPRAAFLTGLCFGIAATIRPLDAASFALPAGGWLAWRALRGGAPHWRALLWSGLGIAIPLAALLAVNSAQSGHPLEFGYITMWGASHELGFHEAPWGFPHTPARGLELINLYFLRLQGYFLETPVPSLLFATAALALTRALTAFDRVMLIGCALLVLGYFAYWHDGFYLGPRFLLPLTPWLALWTARLPATLASRHVSIAVQRMVLTAGITSLVLGGLILLPLRAEQYRSGMSVMRLDADAAAEDAGVTDAVVLVRESWAAQLVVRMWALGVSRAESQRLFARMDACALEQLLSRIERQGGNSANFLGAAQSIAATSPRLVRLRSVGDSSVHLTAGAPIAEVCLRRISENQAGFTLFTPLLLAGRSGNLFRRDLHARDSLLLRMHPSRPVYLLVKDTTAAGALHLLPVSLDSALVEWRSAEAQQSPLVPPSPNP